MTAPAAVSAAAKLSFQGPPKSPSFSLDFYSLPFRPIYTVSAPRHPAILLRYTVDHRAAHRAPTADQSLQDTNTRNPSKDSSLAKQVMTQAAAARQQSSSSQTPPLQQSNEDGRNHAPHGTASGLVPPPSAPPALVSAVKNMHAVPDPSQTLRERPAAAVLAQTFDSPYARSVASTAPGSPRM